MEDGAILRTMAGEGSEIVPCSTCGSAMEDTLGITNFDSRVGSLDRVMGCDRAVRDAYQCD
jgi:hypothetical protein